MDKKQRKLWQYDKLVNPEELDVGLETKFDLKLDYYCYGNFLLGGETWYQQKRPKKVSDRADG